MKWFIFWLIYCGFTMLAFWSFGMQFHPSLSFGLSVLLCIVWGFAALSCAKDEKDGK